MRLISSSVVLALLACGAAGDGVTQAPSEVSAATVGECDADGSCAADLEPTAVLTAVTSPSDIAFAEGSWISDSAGLLSASVRHELNANLTRLNMSMPFHVYLAVLPDYGELKTSRDFGRKVLPELVKLERLDRHAMERAVLVLLFANPPRAEIVLGPKARRKVKDATLKRVSRRVTKNLELEMKRSARESAMEGADAGAGEGAAVERSGVDPAAGGGVAPDLDQAARLSVRLVGEALKKKGGVFASLRGLVMPVAIGFVMLFYMWNKGASAQRRANMMAMQGGGGMGGMPGMGGGMGGMSGMGGPMGMGGMTGLGGGMGGMGMGMDPRIEMAGAAGMGRRGRMEGRGGAGASRFEAERDIGPDSVAEHDGALEDAWEDDAQEAMDAVRAMDEQTGGRRRGGGEEDTQDGVMVDE